MKPKVLVADDDPILREGIKAMLEMEGLDVITAVDGQEALDKFSETSPDLVLTDVKMPRVDGFEVCRVLKSNPDTRLVPVIIVTGLSAVEDRVTGIDAGADDVLTKPFEPVELVARTRSLLRLKRYTDELERAETVIFALSEAIEGKDPYTEGHCDRLSTYGTALARLADMGEEEVDALWKAGIVHDVGKVAVPDSILKKRGPLSGVEFEMMKEHPVVGERICRPLKTFGLVLPIIRHHHEKLDGSGYPDGLAGDEIPMTARIITIVDVFDALSTERPYKPAFEPEKVMGIMEDEVEKGWWDADLFDLWKGYVAEHLS